MHMRTKKWAMPELTICKYYISDPEPVKGTWYDMFQKKQPLYLELGCGKGVSTAQMAFANQDRNFIAVDISPNVLGDTRRNISAVYSPREPENILITKYNIEYISKIFSPEDQIERIYINFCNPWSEKTRHEKRRLTHPRQLQQYMAFLKKGSEIWFKTDDDTLFSDSLVYFEKCGFGQRFLTYDLHASNFAPNYITEHEQKFTDMGIPIKFGIFTLPDQYIPFDATRWKAASETIEE